LARCSAWDEFGLKLLGVLLAVTRILACERRLGYGSDGNLDGGLGYGRPGFGCRSGKRASLLDCFDRVWGSSKWIKLEFRLVCPSLTPGVERNDEFNMSFNVISCFIASRATETRVGYSSRLSMCQEPKGPTAPRCPAGRSQLGVESGSGDPHFQSTIRGRITDAGAEPDLTPSPGISK
jgi:hypothetical protein